MISIGTQHQLLITTKEAKQELITIFVKMDEQTEKSYYSDKNIKEMLPLLWELFNAIKKEN